MAVKIPAKVPRPGFYYHYKHDPDGDVNNYAYVVIGIGFHTETDICFVNYIPLYPSSVYNASIELGIMCFDSRPISMWLENVEVNGEIVPRFKEVTDPERIEKLTAIRNEMYK